MGKVKNIDRKKQDDQAVPANPFLRINLFPGFVATQATKDIVEARLAELRRPRKVENTSNSDVE
jgi:hypothetical protein